MRASSDPTAKGIPSGRPFGTPVAPATHRPRAPPSPTMSILTRYLIRAHVGPFLFALTALTGLLFLNTVATHFEELAGKGLPLTILLEYFILSLPHIIALTLPMAVLVAVLYAFSEVTSSNEFTAMEANGLNPRRVVAPVVATGALVAVGMFFFNDQLLPETNHRLKNLMVDINRKSPTLQLREQVVNEIQTENQQQKYYLQATGIDQETNRLVDVAIYDLSEAGRARTIYADRGTMAFNRQRTDLFLTLYDGVLEQGSMTEPASFQRLFFEEYVLPLRGIGDAMERRARSEYRSDRELSTAMLGDRAEEIRGELERIREEAREASVAAVRTALGLPVEEDPGSGGVEVDTTDARIQAARNLRRAGPGDDDLVASTAREIRVLGTEERMRSRRYNSYRVEIFKKYAIAFACLVFVLLGAPLAVRAPRGGVGMVIGVSLAVFGLYWVGLIGGENLADRGIIDPFWAMWTPNLVLLALSVLALRSMGEPAATPQGTRWSDFLLQIPVAFRRWRSGSA